MNRRKDEKAGYARLLDAWTPPPDAGEPLGCVATSYTFSSTFFEEECIGRFVSLDSDAAEDGAAFLVEREEKFSQLICAAALVDQRHARGLRSLRWDLLAARLPSGILHAKISLLLWTQAARLIVASANLTEDGYRRNQEVFGVIEYRPGSSAPLNVLLDFIAFLEDASRYVNPNATAPDPAIKRWRTFLDCVRASTRDWGVSDFPRGTSPRIHAILTGPGRGSVFDGVGTAWRESTPPENAWIVSPFFDPPEAPSNAPAQEIWKHLRQRGTASVCYVVQGEDIAGTEKVLLHAPKTINWKPANRSVTVTVDQLENDPSRPLHAKCLRFEGAEWFVYVCGSSNFTSAGLGIGSTRNLEANLAYAVNFKRDKESTRSCNQAWLKHKRPSREIEFLAASDNSEDSPNGDFSLLPTAFGSATFAREQNGESWIDFTFYGKPPAGWQALPDDESTVFLDERMWEGCGAPETLQMPWTNSRPPVGFRIIGPTIEGGAWWPVNVRDGASIPAPAELSELSLEGLIHLLTSAQPPHRALQHWLKRQSKDHQGSSKDPLDPHSRVDTSTFLLQRTRRVCQMLIKLRNRLERPYASRQALDWRLRGPIGVQAIRSAIEKEARSGEERTFLLVELMLELGRVRPSESPGGLPLSEVKSELRSMVDELRAALAVQSVPTNPDFRAYLDAANATKL